MSYFIDTHSHIYYKEYKNDLKNVIDSANKNNVKKIICIGTDIETSYESIEIANKYSEVYCTVGCHPHEASKMDDNDILELEKMCENPKVVGIGETGLDYYYSHSSPEIQKKRFIDQIELSKSLDLPLVIHNRDSDEDLMKILDNYRPRGVIHCFSGDTAMAKKAINLGMLLSFTGIVTFKNSSLGEVVKEVDLDKIMLETDSPYLTPTPFRGKRNEPKHVKIIANKIAEIKNIPIKKVAEKTTKNALKLFNKIK